LWLAVGGSRIYVPLSLSFGARGAVFISLSIGVAVAIVRRSAVRRDALTVCRWWPADRFFPRPAHQLELKLAMELMGAEDHHEDKRLAVQETGRKTGSFNTFIRYLENEGATIYAVLAGPVLFS